MEPHATLAHWVRADEATRAALESAARQSSATAGAWLGADRSLGRLAGALAAALAGTFEITRWNGEEGVRAFALGSHVNAPG